METIVEAPEIRLRFGQSVSMCAHDGQLLQLDLAVPFLAGVEEERVLPWGEAASIEKAGAFHLLRGVAGEVQAGVAVLPCGGLAEPVSYQLYREMLEIVGDQSLYRVWHFIPGINAETDGLEHYRSFNIGRCRAFRECFGDELMEAHLPAASAVGTADPRLALLFVTGRDPARYFENPHQVPAYQYPEQYGPCSPSFARGAVVDHADGSRTGYLSGTASIRGHESVARDDLSAQLDITLENVSAVLEQMGFPGAIDSASPYAPQFRVYLRQREDLELVRRCFAEKVGEAAAARTVFLEADICRADLRLEIEGIFRDLTGLSR